MGLHTRVHWIWFRHNIYDCGCVLVGVQWYRECCAERRTSDSGERFVHEFDPYRCYTLAATLGLYIVSSLVFMSYNLLARRLLTFIIVESLSRDTWLLP
jgi:hypothetical protein